MLPLKEGSSAQQTSIENGYQIVFQLAAQEGERDGGWAVVKNDKSVTSYQRSKSAAKVDPPEDISLITLTEGGVNCTFALPRMENVTEYREVCVARVSPEQKTAGTVVGAKLIIPDTCVASVREEPDGQGLYFVLAQEPGTCVEFGLHRRGVSLLKVVGGEGA